MNKKILEYKKQLLKEIGMDMDEIIDIRRNHKKAKTHNKNK